MVPQLRLRGGPRKGDKRHGAGDRQRQSRKSREVAKNKPAKGLKTSIKMQVEDWRWRGVENECTKLDGHAKVTNKRPVWQFTIING